MKKLLILFGVLFFIAFVSAVVSVENNFRQGIIEDDGSLTTTSLSVNNVNAIGFVCSSSNCANVSAQLFNGQNLDSNGQTSLILNYPTTLLSNFGYGVYFYRDQYIPFEVAANWSGNGNAPSQFVYLSKKRNCVVPINSINVSDAGNSLNVNVNVNSPLNHGGPLDYVPSQLTPYYEARVTVEVSANSDSESLFMDIPFSQNRNYQFSLPKVNGSNLVNVQAFTTESYCLNIPVSIQNTTFFVQNETNDMTPPFAVSNLVPVNITNSTIKWTWNNPNNPDFSHVVVYLDGVNVVNTSGNNYLASGLMQNTTHTITLNTVDNSGNVNFTNVSSTATTLIGNQTLDTIPPGQITNLRAVSVTDSTIKWTWNNPTDSDFSMAIIYLDGVNVANITGNMYTATGLEEDTRYTITVYTKDFSGNVNNNGVSDTERTDVEDDDDNNDDKENRRVFDPLVEQPVNVKNFTVEDFQETKLGVNEKENNYWLFVILLLFAVILLVVLIILLAIGRK